jgi:hypothetical protein
VNQPKDVVPVKGRYKGAMKCRYALVCHLVGLAFDLLYFGTDESQFLTVCGKFYQIFAGFHSKGVVGLEKIEKTRLFGQKPFQHVKTGPY